MVVECRPTIVGETIVECWLKRIVRGGARSFSYKLVRFITIKLSKFIFLKVGFKCLKTLFHKLIFQDLF